MQRFADSEYCMSGMEYAIEMALEVSDIACEYRDVAELCQTADTRRECRNVPDYEEGMPLTTSLLYAHMLQMETTK